MCWTQMVMESCRSRRLSRVCFHLRRRIMHSSTPSESIWRLCRSSPYTRPCSLSRASDEKSLPPHQTKMIANSSEVELYLHFVVGRSVDIQAIDFAHWFVAA